MDNKLFDHITFNQQRFQDVTDHDQIGQVIEVARKLEPIKEDIFMHPRGHVDIRSSGNLVVNHFPRELANRIFELLQQRG